ncbi:hypothetical protein Prum_039220 [Phytohabitans rumicis]|uniref:Uncharacterized protein n=1 Tax=Phytohabitans rumicis TaxID=1076125 RepID=A0A6V8L413_9ACTN|nr:hypothetical protein Prum_039220 [Phytohabitans rumicis]
MHSHAAGDITRNGYDENTAPNSGDTTDKPPTKRRRTPDRRRRAPATITDVRVGRIETVTMTAEEETEAVKALAVLVARYWRAHPDHAA